jgi:glycine/D-amino acid oxidase-like deaminating enzyme
MAILATLADRAVRTFPTLRDVRINRTWAALRVMSPDGFPIYDQSRAHPGAFLATCHSGVTLAAAHALELAPQILLGTGTTASTFFCGRQCTKGCLTSLPPIPMPACWQ